MPLPSLPYTRSMFRPVVRTVFGGMNRNPNAGDGEIYDMENLTGRDYPLLSTRPLRSLMYPLSSDSQPVGSIGVLRGPGESPGEGNDPGVLYFWTERAAGGTYAELHLRDNVEEHVLSGLQLADGQKRFAIMGNRIVIFPDKVMVTVTDDGFEAEPLEASWTGAAEFVDGTAYGEPAEGNTVRMMPAPALTLTRGAAPILTRTQTRRWSRLPGAARASQLRSAEPSGFLQLFRVGDAVELSFSNPSYTVNDKTVIIRELTDTELRFDENALDTFYPMTFTGTALGPSVTYYLTRNGRLYYFTGETVSAENVLRLPGGEENENALLVYDTASDTAPSREITLLHDQDTPAAAWTELGFVPDGNLTVQRRVPDLEGITVHNNRLWGYAGNDIYASKLGDPLNFESFDGTAEDSWALEDLSAERYSGCAAYQDYPTFFTETGVWRIYGDKPENFSIRKAADTGVRQDSARSIAEVAGTLFWLSPWGVCAWRGGGEPMVISVPLGERLEFEDGAAAGDGVRLYISMCYRSNVVQPFSYIWGLYVYDTQRGTWHLEDNMAATEMVQDGSTVLWIEGPARLNVWASADVRSPTHSLPRTWPVGLEPATFQWKAEFGDSTRLYETTDTGSQNKKGLLRLLLRCELDSGSEMKVWVRYDSAGEWQELRTIGATAKQSFHVPLILRRCDHYRLKLEGTGPAKIYSITEEKYGGSWLQTK